LKMSQRISNKSSEHETKSTTSTTS